jgi:hypothetical protein
VAADRLGELLAEQGGAAAGEAPAAGGRVEVPSSLRLSAGSTR